MTQITYSELRNSHITLYEQFLSLADIFRLQPTMQSCLNLFQYSITKRKSLKEITANFLEIELSN